jgi:hypothetical protein
MSTEPLRLKTQTCKHLRSKEMFYDNGIPLEERGSSGIFWCMRTHHCMGPDGTAVDREDCVPGRSCYQEE